MNSRGSLRSGRQRMLGPDRTLTVPLVESIPLLGLTTDQARTKDLAPTTVQVPTMAPMPTRDRARTKAPMPTTVPGLTTDPWSTGNLTPIPLPGPTTGPAQTTGPRLT